MEYHNGKLCISRDELVVSEKNPNGLITRYQCDEYVKQGMKVVRRGCFGGHSSLYDIETTPPGIKALLMDTQVTPAQQATDKPFRDKIIIDEKAVAFYLGYEYDSENPEKRLPKDKQREYVVNASVLNAIKCEWDETSIARKRAGGSMKGFWKEANEFVTRITTELQAKPEDVLYMMNLPLNQISLKRKFKRYVHGAWIGEGEEKRFVIGYEALIKDTWCNKYAELITPEILAWVVKEMGEGRQSIEMVTMRYPMVAKENGWNPNITPAAFRNRVSKPEVAQAIRVAQWGKTEFRNRNGMTFKIKKAKYSNDVWENDGTSFSAYFQENGTINHATVSITMDGRSRKFLGWVMEKGINKETHQMEMECARMALRNSGARPYQYRYDNQAGHKTKQAQTFYSQLAHYHFPTRANRPSGKHIEGAFKNFQTLILAQYPFWTGFGRDTQSDLRYAPNYEDCKKNRALLPTFDELKQLFEMNIAEWNELDFSGKGSPNKIYAESRNPEEKAVTLEEMAEMFWNVRGPIKYQAAGIMFIEKGEEMWYQVHTSEGDIDFDFRRKHLKEKFFIKYDPEFEYKDVELYQEHPSAGMQLIAKAQPKRETSNVLKYQNEGDRAWIDKQLKLEDEFFDKMDDDIKATGYDEVKKYENWKTKLNSFQQKEPVMANNDDNTDDIDAMVIDKF